MDYVSQTRRRLRHPERSRGIPWRIIKGLTTGSLGFARDDRRFFFQLRLALSVTLAFALLSCQSFDWLVLKRSLRNKFGDDNWITTQQLANWLADKQRSAPVLLDVRTAAEWKVSHLPGARRVEPGASAATAAGDIAQDAPIVTYCAVGYRSAEMAQRLRSAGYTNVQNLEGSIFEWANEHRPLVRDGEPTKQVHPYSATWGHLLSNDVRAIPPPD